MIIIVIIGYHMHYLSSILTCILEVHSLFAALHLRVLHFFTPSVALTTQIRIFVGTLSRGNNYRLRYIFNIYKGHFTNYKFVI